MTTRAINSCLPYIRLITFSPRQYWLFLTQHSWTIPKVTFHHLLFLFSIRKRKYYHSLKPFRRLNISLVDHTIQLIGFLFHSLLDFYVFLSQFFIRVLFLHVHYEIESIMVVTKLILKILDIKLIHNEHLFYFAHKLIAFLATMPFYPSLFWIRLYAGFLPN